MAVTYKLQIHSRDVLNIGNHTGYDLVKYVNGIPTEIRSLDLTWSGLLDITINDSGWKTVVETEDGQIWGTKIFIDGGYVDYTPEMVEDEDFQTAIIVDNSERAQEVFSWMLLDAQFRNELKNVDGGLLTYDALELNCNVWTNTMAQNYLGINNIFTRLEGTFQGSNETMTTGAEGTDLANCQQIASFLSKFKSEISSKDYDISNAEVDLVQSGNGWYCRINNCNIDGIQCTYIYDTDNGSEIKLERNQNSFVYGEDGENKITTGNGNDVIYGGKDKDVIIAGNGENKIYAGDGQNHITTGSDNDEIHSGKDYDIINAGGGDDHVYAGDGGGQIDLGSGKDYFEGGSGADMVNSGQGNDTIYTYAGNDDVNTQIGAHTTDTNHVYLGAGSDTFTGGVGIDIVDGGVSDDIETDKNTINLGAGNDEYRGGKGKDIVHGGADDDHIWGGDGENKLYGDSGSDHLYGGSGNDELYGGTGVDYLYAGTGINKIDCGVDNNSDFVCIQNNASGIDTIYHINARDRLACAGGFNISTLTQVGRDVVLYGNRGNKIILKNIKLTDDGYIPAENMPVLYQPDGTVLQWNGTGYVDSGADWPPYEELPENPEELPLISDSKEGEEIPWISNCPPVPEDGTTKTQDENSTSIPESTKDEIEKLWKTAENSRSPLVVDLDGDNKIETISTDGGIHFDFDNNQKVENSGWIGKNEGFLVRDINGNGQIDNGTEMFGNHTLLQNGKNAANGFEALKDLDTNKNGKFDAEDEAWSEVKVWRDSNTNGRVDEGELLTLEQAGIESINLGYNYQKNANENGNIEIQQGTFNRIDGTTGKISDIWFDADGTKTLLNEEDITIPDNIKYLPNIEGWGNVYSLHAAMALDESGSLKSLVEQYMSATDESFKDSLLNNIIYHWTGVQNMDPEGRNPSQIYGNVLGDARKLEALEEFLGEEFLGTWCWGERDPNPHGHAAPMIIQAFNLLKNYIGTYLSANLQNNPYLEKIILTYNAETKHWDVNVDQAVALLQAAFDADMTNGKIAMLQLSNILRFYDNADEVIAAFQAKGAAEGTFFETELLNFGHNSIGTSASDNLFGTDGNDFMNGLAGNDIIKAAKGDDTVLGGTGNDYIYGEDGDDVLSGEEGNDYLFGGDGNDVLIGGAGNDVLSGGNGADIYQFEKGFGNDSIDNTQDESEPNSDIIKFGEGILPQNATLNRQGYDLIISLSYGDGTSDSVRVFSYFNNQGTSSTTVSAIQFADGTSWDYEYVLNHWNSMPDVNGGVTLEGNNENNTINGTSANDILIGNGGDDTISGNAGNDYIYGGTGNDYMSGGSGNDTYLWNLGDGLDIVYDTGNLDTIQFGEGIVWDYLTFQNSGNNLKILVHGQENQGIIIRDFFYNQNYKIEKINFFDGTSVNLSEIGLTLKQLNTGETIKGTEFDDIIYANDGFDTVNAGDGDDTIYGGNGFDTLYGENGNDTLIGGKGNDILNGGYGNDTYIWNLGDGLDTIYDYESSTTTGRNDKIKFGEGISPEDVKLRQEGNDLHIIVNDDSTQGIIIDDFFANDYYKVEYVEFADGTSFKITDGVTFEYTDASETVGATDGNDTIYGMGGDDIITAGSGNDTIIGGTGNDTLNGGYGEDTYIWNLGDGFDTITDYESSSSTGRNDKIKFGEGIAPEDVTFRHVGNDLIINVNGDSSQGMLIKDFFANDYYKVEYVEFADGTSFKITDGVTFEYTDASETVGATDGNDVIYGNGGDDNISAGNGNDVIVGGKGNDTLNGGYGNDTYIWNLGDGFDTIYDYESSSSTGRNDKIKFGEGIAPEDATFRHVGNDLIINVNGDSSQGMLIKDFFANDYYKVEYVEFADGTSFKITDGVTFEYTDAPETVGATDGNDVIYGLGGNDTITAGNGNDIIVGGKGNDILNGGYGNDTYIWNLGDGFDTIYDYESSSSTGRSDKIKFGEGIAPEDVTFRHVGNDLIINVNGDSSQGMLIKDFFANDYYKVEYVEFADGTSFKITDGVTFKYTDAPETVGATDGNDVIYGNGGDDTITAGNGDDVIVGGKGNDKLNGGYGNDTYIWNLGDGFDTIYDYESSSSTGRSDKIKFGEGIVAENLTFYRTDNDLIISINGDLAQGINIKDFFANDYYKIEYIEFANGDILNLKTDITVSTSLPYQTITGDMNDNTLTGGNGKDIINGNDGSDIITGNQGNDILNGGNDDDTYVWNLGDGFDTITDEHGEFDIISFGENIAYEDLTFSRVGDDLHINVNANSNQGMKIVDFYKYDANKIEYLEFSDGSLYDIATSPLVWSLSNGDDTVSGTDYDDTIYGNGGNDTISAGNGDDTLIGGTGNDTLNGGADNDTYVYNLGDGLDTITDTQGVADKIKFGIGIASSDITFRQNGSDLQIFVNAALTEGMIVKDFYKSGGANQIEFIEFADGSKLNISAMGLTLSQSSGDDVVTGTDYEDVVYGNGGNDTINTGNGDDMLIGGTGNDTLNGGNGNDTYVWNSGDGLDTITDGQGVADKILFGTGINLNNLKFTQEGKNLRIYVNDDIEQGVVIVNFYNSNTDKIEKLEFADGSTFNLATQGLTLTQPNGNNVVNGTVYADVIYGNDGMDTISTGNGHDTLVGGKGNDILDGGRGNDTYKWNLGDGMDTITDANGNDKIVFGAGISEADVKLTQEGNNLRITIKDDFNQGMLIKNFFSATANKVELIEFANGETLDISQGLTLTQTNGSETITGTGLGDVIYGMDGNDTISASGNNTFIGGKGNDTISGGAGNDTYVYNLGDGFDIINESGGNDKIVFGEGISQSDLSFEQIGNNLKISINGDEIKGIQINNHFRYESSKVETIEFHDGSTLNISNADQLIQAMNSFSLSNSASTDTLSDPTQDVSDMYSLAANTDLTKKAI